MKELVSAYSGDHAKNYDGIRSGTPRWQGEVRAMRCFLKEINPNTLLDCPFGTGRWVGELAEMNCRVVGVDLSRSMLEEARRKIDSLHPEAAGQITLIEDSIFELTEEKIGQNLDLILCIRFANWVPFKDLEKLVAVFSNLNSKEIVLGVSVIPESSSPLQTLKYLIALKVENIWKWKSPRQFVHHERKLVDLLARSGWTIIEQLEIFRNSSRINYFYRLGRA